MHYHYCLCVLFFKYFQSCFGQNNCSDFVKKVKQSPIWVLFTNLNDLFVSPFYLTIATSRQLFYVDMPRQLWRHHAIQLAIWHVTLERVLCELLHHWGDLYGSFLLGRHIHDMSKVNFFKEKEIIVAFYEHYVNL